MSTETPEPQPAICLRGLRASAAMNLAHGLDTVTIVLPHGVRVPGLPRGELLCVSISETGQEQAVRRVSATRLLKWLDKTEAALELGARSSYNTEGRSNGE